MKKLLCTLCIILMVGCTTTGQAYMPHTSRVFHAKKSCAGCYDPNPIVFQSVQAAASSSGIAPCLLCVKPKSLRAKNQGYTATNYATSGGNTGGSNSKNLPPAKSKSSVAARILGGVLVTLGIVAIAVASASATPTQTYTPTPNLALQPRYSSSDYSNPSSVFNTTPSYGSSGTSSNFGGGTTYHNYSDGTSGTSSDYGSGTTYHSFSNGTTGTSSDYGGNTTYHNFSNGTTGTSSNYGGNTTYHNYSDGTTGTSSNYGGSTTYHSYSDGTTGTSSNYGGNTTYHNLSGN